MMIKHVFLGIVVIIIPLYSMAWGMLGHRIIGEIADQHLTTKARTEIRKILGNESLAMASNWADLVKSNKSYDSLYSWHFINLPSGLDSTQIYIKIKKDTAVNLYSKLQLIIQELKTKRLSNEKRVMYLRLLIHFVGDAHQPMHTARPEDRGGNDIKLYWFNAPTNLHQIWDKHLIEYQQLSYTEHSRSINFTSSTQRRKWQAQPVHQWLTESYLIAEKLYQEIEPKQKLSYNYNFNHVDLMNQQLLKGGIRLAGILNQIFG